MSERTVGSPVGSGFSPAGAADVARHIREGATTAVAAVEGCIERIEAYDGVINAVVQRRFDRALTEAAEADARQASGEAVGSLHGVPITVKDQYDVAGMATTLGLASRRGRPAASDGPLVGRLRRAGAIIVGKTNVPQVLLAHESDNFVFGRTSNPWDVARTSGGSSGGEAAAVAYGASALGLAGDFGGSIRGPAAFCGVTGLKPTAWRLTGLDTPPEPFGKQEAIPPQPGPIARNVADLVLAMSVLAAPGQEAVDPLVPPVGWVKPPDDAAALRVGWADDNGLFRPSPAIRRAVREAAAALEHQGARVVEVPLPDGRRTHALFMALVGADRLRPTRAAVRGEKVHPLVAPLFMSARLPNSAKRVIGPVVRASGRARLARLLAVPMPPTPYDYFELLHERARLLTDLMATWDAAGVDVVISPACGLPAPHHGTAADLWDAFSYLTVANLFGLPAGVVPITTVGAGEESDRPASRDAADRLAVSVEQGSAGLPVAVQVIGRPWREDLVLSAMAAIERAARHGGTAPLLPVDPLTTAGPAPGT